MLGTHTTKYNLSRQIKPSSGVRVISKANQGLGRDEHGGASGPGVPSCALRARHCSWECSFRGLLGPRRLASSEQSAGLWTTELGLWSMQTSRVVQGLHCPWACGIFYTGIEPVFPASQVIQRTQDMVVTNRLPTVLLHSTWTPSRAVSIAASLELRLD